MKTYILIFSFLVLPFILSGETVCLYESWMDLNENKGDTVGGISVCKRKQSVLYDLKCKKENKKLSKRIKKKVIVAKSDSLILINSAYLKKRFRGTSGLTELTGYVPFYYSDKIRYIRCNSGYMHSTAGRILWPALGGLVGGVIMYGVIMGADRDDKTDIMHYVLDFWKHKIVKINYDELKKLLEAYPDIKDAFLNTPDCEKLSVVNHYFKEYVKALHCDSVYNFIPYTEPERQ